MVGVENTILTFLKTQNTPPDKTHTHTRIGSKQNAISGGSYFVDNSDMKTFWQKYYDSVCVNGMLEYLTEKQLVEDGPIMIDLDLRYDSSIKTRQHKEQHVVDFIHKYLEMCNDVLDINTESENDISAFVMEKDFVNCLEDKTKDGVHIIIGIKCHKAVQILLREKMLKEIEEIWDDLPITNDWKEVFDEGVTRGTVNWQLYGSRKPLHDPYKVRKYYSFKKDENDLWGCTEYNLDTFNKNLKKNIVLLSARNNTWEAFNIRDKYVDIVENHKNKSNRKNTGKLVPRKADDKLNMMSYLNLLKINKAPIIDEKVLDRMFNDYFDDIIERKDVCNYKIKEIHEYTLSLPDTYYGKGSYYNWIRVGWALKNADERLFMTWLKFSSREICRDSLKSGGKFDWSRVSELYDFWEEFDIDTQFGLTERSIMYWCKKDAPEKYDVIHKDTVNYFIDRTLDYQVSDKGKGCPAEFDIAKVLWHVYKDRYVCVSVKNNLWYEFRQNRWHELDSGTNLRESMSTELYQFYMDLTQENVAQTSNSSQSTNDEGRNRSSRLANVAQLLKRTNWKNNIMREARETFYDSTFYENLDANPHLLCFNNYVIDFKENKPENRYRRGRPDDYISKSTNIDYIDYSVLKSAHKDIEDQIDTFMSQLFPDERLRRYVWEHLASSLIGTNENQTFNCYLGTGRNGKSKLVDLMSKCMGDYKHTVPVTLVTTKRPTLGGTSSEIAQLKGIRYAVMQEPSELDVLNEGVLKELTGGDPVQGRALYKDMDTFIPQFTLVVCANERIKINATDDGTWRRVKEVPFDAKFLDYPNTKENPNNNDDFPYGTDVDQGECAFQFKIDRKLDQKFDSWAPVFIAKLVDKAFKTGGAVDSHDCDKVNNASNDYRESQDIVKLFLKEKIIKGNDDDFIKKSEITEEWSEWCSQNNIDRKTKPKNEKLYKKLQNKIKIKYNKNDGWKGWKICYNEHAGNGSDDE